MENYLFVRIRYQVRDIINKINQIGLWATAI